MSFSRFVFYRKLLFVRNQKTKGKNKVTMLFLLTEIESSQYVSPQIRTPYYTKVMNIFHTSTHVNDIKYSSLLNTPLQYFDLS